VISLKIKAIIFDVSGTLIDPKSSEKAHKIILSKILENYDLAERIFPKFKEKVLEIFNKSSLSENYKEYYKICYEALKSVVDCTEEKITLEEYKRLYISIVPETEELYPDVIDILKILKKKYKLGIVTDGDREYIERLFELKGLTKFFDAIVCSEDVREYKPHPKVFRKALEILDVQPIEAIYIGDNPIKDKEGPEKIGMRAIIVKDGIKFNDIRDLLEGFKNGTT